jgi:hypothetical protein
LLRHEFGDDDGETMSQPSDMTVTRDGDLAVVDCGLLCVKVFDTQGSQQMTFGNAEIFALPIAITIDSIGRFLVCDQVRGVLYIRQTNNFVSGQANYHIH